MLQNCRASIVLSRGLRHGAWWISETGYQFWPEFATQQTTKNNFLTIFQRARVCKTTSLFVWKSIKPTSLHKNCF
jgi:hypothetical protein